MQPTNAPKELLQSQPVPAGVPTVKPDWMVSVTETSPVVGLPPLLVTDNVKLFPADPSTNAPLDVLAIANAGGVVVFTISVLLIAVGLPPPLTTAVLITATGAFVTSIGITIGGYRAPPPFRESPRMQRTSPPENTLQSHPVPAGTPTDRSDEMTSVTVTKSVVMLFPLLAIDKVKLFPADPFTKVPVDDLVIDNAGPVVVFTITELLVAVALPPPLTAAVFVTVAGAVTTMTGITIDGYCAPPPLNASVRVHRTFAPEDVLQSHPVPAGVPTAKAD